MTEKKYKFPMIFDYMLTTLIFLMFVAIFFGEEFLSLVYFLTLLVLIVYSILDRKYGAELSDHRVTYFLFNIAMLICLISILGFNMDTFSITLNLLLVSNVFFAITLLIVDVFLVVDDFFDNHWCWVINVSKLCIYICLFTYLNNVTSVCYAIFSLIFILINILAKVYCSARIIKAKKMEKITISEFDETNSQSQTEGTEEGDIKEIGESSEDNKKENLDEKTDGAEAENTATALDSLEIEKIIISNNE